MGTWGVGIFENDNASDFMYDFVEENPVEYMMKAFSRFDSEYLEVDEAHEILISAAILDMVLTEHNYSDFNNDEFTGFISKVKSLEVSTLVPSAIKAIDRVMKDNSELFELWEESNSFEEWSLIVTSIKSRLSGI